MSELIRNAAEDVAAGRLAKTTVRALVADFGGKRRREAIVQRIRDALRAASLITNPDFTTMWIDSEIEFVPAPQATSNAQVPSNQQTEPPAREVHEPREARQLIRMLDAANRGVVAVTPQDSLELAITQMMVNDYSQLPVMIGARTLKGAISWKSIGLRLVQGVGLRTASDAMEPATTVRDTDTLLEATSLIIRKDFVFVLSSVDNRITGIVTATDLSEQFRALSEPFLLIGQIEMQLRNLLDGRLDVTALRAACDPGEPDRAARINGASDLTFGEYVRLLEPEANWSRLRLACDRVTVLSALNEVREIRNDVMHFDPDGLEDEQIEKLRRFSDFLTQLERLDGLAPTSNN